MNSTAIQLTRWKKDSEPSTEADRVAVEEPLEIRVNGRSVAVTMRTPGHDRELAAGFLFTEGVLKRADELLDLLVCKTQPEAASGNVVDAQVAASVGVDFERLTRHVFSASSCGLCGKATIDALFQNFPPVTSAARFSAEDIAALPEKLRAAQPGFGATGGVHASALFSADGTLRVLREDVGRHNALDKVIGQALLAGELPLSETILLVSGRVSFELVQKALAAGIPLIAGIGAPSSLAVECAQRGGQTLVGFLRVDKMNVYTGAERLGLTVAELTT
ncbi:formate dehydrogenase accessory sulfurtransferase FdhD [Oleiharenicola lentus]|uniref:formate dehydrogenase accessory sulfurtransferase FdhD n=1 Tax=Oleiharenicola lentus TaxID=2508720 RepID=UPI003F66427D